MIRLPVTLALRKVIALSLVFPQVILHFLWQQRRAKQSDLTTFAFVKRQIVFLNCIIGPQFLFIVFLIRMQEFLKSVQSSRQPIIVTDKTA